MMGLSKIKATHFLHKRTCLYTESTRTTPPPPTPPLPHTHMMPHAYKCSSSSGHLDDHNDSDDDDKGQERFDKGPEGCETSTEGDPHGQHNHVPV